LKAWKHVYAQERVEDTKVVFRSRKSKDR